jgi:cytochrome oxidase Cu insertion factor (SCO1/SenC/PrrC family)
MSAENPTERSAEAVAAQRKSRRMLLLLAAVCIAPFVGSFALYFFWQPSGRINYGELVEGVMLPTGSLAQVNAGGGKAFDFAQVRGRWVFVTVDSGACDAYCQNKLWKMRQVRMTQGKSLERIERVWLLNDAQTIEANVLKEYQGTWIAGAQGNAVLKSLPYREAQRDHIYLVDPLGNVVLRYPKDANPSRMKKDLERLLRVSRIG